MCETSKKIIVFMILLCVLGFGLSLYAGTSTESKTFVIQCSSQFDTKGNVNAHFTIRGFNGFKIEHYASLESQKPLLSLVSEPNETDSSISNPAHYISTIIEPCESSEQPLIFKISDLKNESNSYYIRILQNQEGMITITKGNDSKKGITPSLVSKCPTGCTNVTGISEKCGEFSKCCQGISYLIDFTTCSITCNDGNCD